MHNFAILQRAKISNTLFSELIGVSRVTVTRWCGSGVQPNKFVDRKVGKLLAAISRAVKNKELPAEPGPEREKQIRRVLYKQLQNKA